MAETEYIPNFKEKLQAAIDQHKAEAVRLTRWLEGLETDGFNWDEVTETQAWAIWKYNCPELAEKEAQR